MTIKVSRVVLIAALVVVGSVALVLAPFAFTALDSPGTDWVRLADIGQAYGSVSVLISGIALVGVSASLAAQYRQTRIAQEYAHREKHHELLRMAIDDPVLMACWDGDTGETTAEQRQRMYLNMIFTFWYSSWQFGTLSEPTVRGLAADIFQHEPGRRFWKTARLMRQAVHTQRIELEFDAMMEEAYQRAVAEQETTPDDSD